MTASARANPFEITKASDFSDLQILDTWVDALGAKRLVDWTAPRSPVPMWILGGKGSGKTHLMRYLSLPIQVLRSRENVAVGIAREGYVGIYMRCGTLNALRFAGKGQDEEYWSTVFAQYMDLWLAKLVLSAAVLLRGVQALEGLDEAAFCRRVSDILRFPGTQGPRTLSELATECRQYQHEVDNAVNNAALSRNLSIRIRSSPGELVFALPQLLLGEGSALQGAQILYLIDELENLDKGQQRYVNTLIRDRSGPCSFRVGSRTWGVRTHQVLNAEEENKRGSEFDELHLDQRMRQEDAAYSAFCKELIARRLQNSSMAPAHTEPKALLAAIERSLESQPRTGLGDAETEFVLRKTGERPYIARLKGQLGEGLRRGMTPGVVDASQVEPLVKLLMLHEHPLVEKAKFLLFYRDWYERRDLRQAAERIHEEGKAYVNAPEEESRLKAVLEHFRGDLLAQLRREYRKGQRYLGLDSFIALSSGLPRNLLILLKYTYQW